VQNWVKENLVYDGCRGLPANFHYASMPTILQINDEIVRVFFASRNKNNFSSIFYLDLFIKGRKIKIVSVSSEPILSPGKPGLFDDCGVTPSCVTKIKEDYYLYYTGWNQQNRIPFQTFCGIAKLSCDFKYAERVYEIPILERSETEPLSVGACFVTYNPYKNIYIMWYESCNKWIVDKTNSNCFFSINLAFSNDGFNWKRENKKCIEPENTENIVARPVVVFQENLYSMWYCAKDKGKYQITYAESEDGENWGRKNNTINFISKRTNWDNEQMCYPYVFTHDNKKYMLYNGNGYGKSGFGLAMLQQ
jgi:predicted GH43/DUF377 family glycosyl hydrolase